MALLSSLELGLHQPEGLASREDCLPILSTRVSISVFAAAHAAVFDWPYSGSRHVDGSLVRPLNDVIIGIGAGERGRGSDRGGDEKSQCGEMNSTSRSKLLLPTLGAGI